MAQKQKAEADAKAKAQEEVRRKSEAEAKEKALAEEAKKKAALDAKKALEEAAKKEALAAALEQEQAEQKAAEKAAENAAQTWVSRYFGPKVEKAWLRPESKASGMSCKITVRLVPTGAVSSVQAQCSGGDAAFERSAEAAVRKASPFPMPPEAIVAKQLLGQTVTFRFNPD